MFFKRTATLAAGPAVSIGLVAAPSVTSAGASTPLSHTDVARYGASYLATQIAANGGHLVAFGAPDVSDTAYAVVGLQATGIGAKQQARAIAYLKTQLNNLAGPDGNDKPNLLGAFILAAVSSRQDPRAFGGTQPVNNLVARLRATMRRSGPDAGLFGTADPTYDGAFRQGIALAALRAAQVHAADLALPIKWLEHQQCANGLWTSYRSNVNVACPAVDPNTFVGPNTNSTAMAVQGLAAFEQHPKSSATLGWLNKFENSDGGWGFLAATNQPSDPDSTALVIQAFVAEGVRPSTAALNGLASFQLGCSDPASSRGAFFYPGSRTANIIATVQSVPAAALKALPTGTQLPGDSVPAYPCS